MWLFWIGAGVLAAAAAALVAWRAAQASARRAGADDPALDVYRRQLAEVRVLAERDLLADGELRAAEAEAGRRLLASAEKDRPAWTGGGARSRLAVTVGAGAAALLAIGLYVGLGKLGAPDQPFRARLAQWRKADPAALAPDQLVAVLSALVRERPRDPVGHAFLARAELAAGDEASAVQSLSRATQLSPNSAALQAELGEAITLAASGKVTPEAEAAFRRARAIDPASVPAGYFLGRARLEAGDTAGALALWRPLASGLAPTDPRRKALAQEIAQAESGPKPQGSPALDADTAALARGMVERLATRLKDRPDDPDGWARLIRAYAVLGDGQARTAALTRARAVFGGRPEALATIEAAAKAAPAAQR